MSASILHLTPSIGPFSGGLGTIALALAVEQQRLSWNTTIWSTDPVAVAKVSAAQAGLEDAIETMRTVGPKVLAFSPAAERRALNADFDIVHQHGIWTAQARVTLRFRRRGIPTIVAPQGSLEAYALRRSAWKKRIALAAYEERNLREAACLHATADSELATFRDFGLRAPVAVIPNGVATEWLTSMGDGHRFRSKHGLTDRRVLLFVSRVDPKKGLLLLVDALASIRERMRGWCVAIAGQDEKGHRAEVEALAKARGVSPMLRFLGPVFGAEKRDMFAAADVFILPTHSDNFAIVIAEALGAGLPVITTHGAPWQELETERCGWWVPIDMKRIADAIVDAVATKPEELKAMGERGRRLVASRYTWPAVATRSIAVYRWLLHEAERPEFVVIN